MNVTKGEKVLLAYGGRQSGLTDVKVDIYKADGNKIESGIVMTELGSTAMYVLEFIPPHYQRGYVAIMDSVTVPLKRYEHIVVGEEIKSGGSVRVKSDIWSDREKRLVFEVLDSLNNKLEELESAINNSKESNIVEINVLDKKLLELREVSTRNFLVFRNDLEKAKFELEERFESKKYDDSAVIGKFVKVEERLQEVREHFNRDRTSLLITSIEDLRFSLEELKKAFVVSLTTDAIERLKDANIEGHDGS